MWEALCYLLVAQNKLNILACEYLRERELSLEENQCSLSTLSLQQDHGVDSL